MDTMVSVVFGLIGPTLPFICTTAWSTMTGVCEKCGASGFFGHRFGVKRVIQTGVADVEES
jgi:hypothetical protein